MPRENDLPTPARPVDRLMYALRRITEILASPALREATENGHITPMYTDLADVHKQAVRAQVMLEKMLDEYGDTAPGNDARIAGALEDIAAVLKSSNNHRPIDMRIRGKP